MAVTAQRVAWGEAVTWGHSGQSRLLQGRIPPARPGKPRCAGKQAEGSVIASAPGELRGALLGNPDAQARAAGPQERPPRPPRGREALQPAARMLPLSLEKQRLQALPKAPWRAKHPSSAPTDPPSTTGPLSCGAERSPWLPHPATRHPQEARALTQRTPLLTLESAGKRIWR